MLEEDELLEPDNGLFVDTHISDKKLKEIWVRYIVSKEEIIAF
ncbi:Methylthioribose kinase [Bacillus cereus Rock4-18]|nr:Methylthioribose kinase [Bacillus cereus Rock4-18]